MATGESVDRVAFGHASIVPVCPSPDRVGGWQACRMAGYYSCMACGHEFDPIATRWFCPQCKFKANCCEGEPL